MSIFNSVRSEFHDLDREDLLKAPVEAIVGVTPEQSSLLKSIGIETVFDLSLSKVFGDARRLAFPNALEKSFLDDELFPRDLLNRSVDFDYDFGDLEISNLAAVSARIADSIKKLLGVYKIAELAAWAPYVTARHLAGLDFGEIADVEGDPEIPDALVPKLNDHASEKVFYSVYSADSKPGADGELSAGVSLDQIAKFKGKTEITTGRILRYEQSWTPIGLTLGNLLHSLALAPGEATRVAVTNWSRQQSASTTESISQNEALSNQTTSARTISEITSAVAREASEGFSSMDNNTNVANSGNANYGLLNADQALTAGAVGAGAGVVTGAQLGGVAGMGIGGAGGAIIGGAAAAASSYGAATAGGAVAGGFAGAFLGGLVGIGTGGLVGGAAGGAMGFMGAANFGSELNSGTNATLESVTVTTTDGTREVESEMMQSVSDQTQQHASSARTRTASIVQEVSQSESENVSTRVVANYNHMHAMTVQYFEVIQVYRQKTRLLRSDPCVYVPVASVRTWTPALIRRFRVQLLASSLSVDFTFHLLAGEGMVGLNSPNFPSERDWLRGLEETNIVKARHVLDSYIGDNPFNNWRVPDDLSVIWISGTPATNTGPVFSSDVDKKLDHSVIAVMRSGERRKAPEAEPDLKLRDVVAFEYEAVVKTGETVDFGEVLREPAIVSFSFRLKLADREEHVTFPVFSRVTKEHVVSIGRNGRSKVNFAMMIVNRTISLKKAIEHLNQNTDWYSRGILRRKDAELSRSLVDNLSFGGSVLGDFVDPEPVAINGNRLVFKLQGAAAARRTKDLELEANEVVPVGTGGVFAEAVLGRANSAEKIDLTRFWNWQDSPIPLTPPEISPISTGSRARDVALTPGRLDAPLVQNTAPRDLPDPQGTIAILNTLQQKLFEDMSGILETAQVAQTAIQQAATASTSTGDAVSENLQKGMEQTGKVVEQASKMVGDFGKMVAEKSLDVLNSGVSGALGMSGSGGGLGSLTSGGASSGGSGGASAGRGRSGSAIAAGSNIASGTSGGLLGNPTTVGGALNAAKKIGGGGASGPLSSPPGAASSNPNMHSAGHQGHSLEREIIESATGSGGGGGGPYSSGHTGLHAGDDPETLLQGQIRSSLVPLLRHSARSDDDFDALSQESVRLIEFAGSQSISDDQVYEAVGDALSRGWKASALRAADRFNAGEHQAIHRLQELDDLRALLPLLIGAANFDLYGLLTASITIEDLSMPSEISGGEQVIITGHVRESLSDGNKKPAAGSQVSLTAKPTAEEALSTYTDAEGRFAFTLNHGVPPEAFDGVHQFEGWFDLEVSLAAVSGRSSLIAEHHSVIPGKIVVSLIGAFDEDTGEDRLIGSVVSANANKRVGLQFKAMIAGQALNRGVQLREADVSVNGDGVVDAVTDPDGDGEFVVMFRPTGVPDTVVYVSPTIRFSGLAAGALSREAVGFAPINVV